MESHKDYLDKTNEYPGVLHLLHLNEVLFAETLHLRCRVEYYNVFLNKMKL